MKSASKRAVQLAASTTKFSLDTAMKPENVPDT
jgi:hypothetical protein